MFLLLLPPLPLYLVHFFPLSHITYTWNKWTAFHLPKIQRLFFFLMHKLDHCKLLDLQCFIFNQNCMLPRAWCLLGQRGMAVFLGNTLKWKKKKSGKWKCSCDIGLLLFHPSDSALWCSFHWSAVLSATLRSDDDCIFSPKLFNMFSEWIKVWVQLLLLFSGCKGIS